MRSLTEAPAPSSPRGNMHVTDGAQTYYSSDEIDKNGLSDMTAMPTLPYPRNTVWYLEARTTQGHGGHATADAASMGSAVLVELETIPEDGVSDKKRQVKRYLLTCAHVVRAYLPGTKCMGPPFEEILCFAPGSAYMRTRKGTRTSGQMDNVPMATVSPLSPCEGKAETIPLVPDADWVLLEVTGNALDHKPVARPWAQELEHGRFDVVGYPGGAGLEVNEGRGHFWCNGKTVESFCGRFESNREADPGFLKLDGEASKRGMSGGGSFTDKGELAGIHREAVHDTMARNSVNIVNIREYLWKHHRMVPVPPPPSDREEVPQPEASVPAPPQAAVAVPASPANPGPTPPPPSRRRVLLATGGLCVSALAGWSLIMLWTRRKFTTDRFTQSLSTGNSLSNNEPITRPEVFAGESDIHETFKWACHFELLLSQETKRRLRSFRFFYKLVSTEESLLRGTLGTPAGRTRYEYIEIAVKPLNKENEPITAKWYVKGNENKPPYDASYSQPAECGWRVVDLKPLNEPIPPDRTDGFTFNGLISITNFGMCVFYLEAEVGDDNDIRHHTSRKYAIAC